MIRLDDRNPVPESLRGGIVALGNFDGFHQGHQAVVGAGVEWARAEGRPAIVATFDPHPMRYFKPDAEPFRLTTLDQRQELFAAAGADAMLVFHFDRALAATPAGRWIEDTIAGRIGAAGVVTGEDFTFGQGRAGNAALLAAAGARCGVSARTVGAVHDGEGPISSSRIRQALRRGDCETATRLLTRPFAIRGPVEHGYKVGRTIGFPTANLALGTCLRPRYGIYAVTGLLPDGRRLRGAANIGIRPSFDPPKELLEPHFFDFSGDLYGQEIEVAFHAFLRP
ncbi:MAG: riboflavin biosynthesis protein RibF, partial [Novosphingobium sp.]|nr:riboflavin biosynthesis protein RibF [Novosphingobium sp.]